MKKIPALLALSCLSSTVFAFDSFRADNIIVEGANRVSTGAVLNAVNIDPGTTIDDEISNQITQALFRMGHFESINLEQRGNDLVIKVMERPAIASIDISGSKTIKNEDLLDSLKEIGFAQGRTFKAVQLNEVRKDILRQLHAVGRYAAEIEVTTEKLERNRVAVKMQITEGPLATIQSIEFRGNRVFSDEALRKQMKSGTSNMLSWFTKDNQYNKAKLSQDMESIKTYAMNRGYMNFKINSAQVSLTEDRKGLKVLFDVHEGEVFTIGNVLVRGTDLIDDKARSNLSVQAGDTFSRTKTTDAMKEISAIIGQAGYPFAEVNPIPEPVAGQSNVVNLVFYVETGKRTIIDKIQFRGNHKTKDQVLRREMNVFEGGVASSGDIEESRTSLMRMGFFDTVDVSTKNVDEGKVDVIFDVTEARVNEFGGGLGYNDSEGLLFNLNMKNKNFMGTGDAFDVILNYGQVHKTVNLHYDQPYWTQNGISRGFNFFFNKTELFEGAHVSEYSTDSVGGSVNFGFPLSQYTRTTLNVGYTYTDLSTNPVLNIPLEIQRFQRENGNSFDEFGLTWGIYNNTYDRGIMPTKGHRNSLSAHVTIPGSNLEYYKINYKGNYYHPLKAGFIFTASTNLSYGEGYGKTTNLPFYKNSFAGGFGTVRGFAESSLGPRDSNGKRFGGNFLATGSLGLVIPNFWDMSAKQYRIALFMDAGQVYDTHDKVAFDNPLSSRNPNGIRASAGIAFSWLSPLGPIMLNVGYPIIKHDGDSVKVLTPSLGVLE